ncbi:BTAD domain-containing putative transcriptional regulator [Micromonospora sp. WMMD812]|uniref:BTAD domain-containing putative transcriptional regulator n=1 Tax=Micromonospora sp. WMMD812 TaxID=3015152 RepID=UPI00248C2A09|nr:BTAD domain-containing putative transcriptional regulator [Micromonospora sp. WMMD812]WBB66303.1 BTAD domain-containing putative transcriptional regulator [Micromonospora sp. WMMD812]
MSGTLRFEILGPQRAWYADRELDLGPGKQRAVLAVLLLAAGRPVPVGQIVEAVWPEEPPANGTNVVQKYVAGLRRVLEPDRSPRTPGQVLSLTDAGYLLRVRPEAIDAVRFERGIHRARQRHAEGRPVEALTELETALGLWHGEPFTGFTGPVFEAARHRVVELRAVALETRAELTLDLGRHREMAGELVELVAEFPVRERLRHQLMLALYRGGRQAEALAAYREFDDLLREEYGIEPGEELRELHRRILRSDPALAMPTAPRPLAASAPPPPAPPAASSGPPAPAPPPVVSAPPAPAPPTAVLHPDSAAPPVAAAAPSPVVGLAFGSPALPSRPPAEGGYPPPGLFPTPERYGQPPRPSQPFQPAPRWISVTGTVLGALTALLSFGLLTWLVVLVYAIWRRSWRNALASLGYLVFVATAVGVVGTGDPDEVTFAQGFLIIAWLGEWGVGVVHTVLLNPVIWSVVVNRTRGPAVRTLDERRVRREQARYLLYHYPAARQELHIGRPDLPRVFDDGGLVDVNAVGEQVVAALPGITAGQARQVVMDRWLRGPFGSMEDLAARCLLPPQLTDPLRDLLVFLAPPSLPAAPPPGSGER